MQHSRVIPLVNQGDFRQSKRLDAKNRPIQKIIVDGRSVNLYVGPDAHGFIVENDVGDYIMVGNEKRWWRGIIDPLPNDPRLDFLKDFGLCSIKPDAFQRGLQTVIKDAIASQGFRIIAEKTLQMERDDIFRLYPYFFESEWESVLVRFFSSGMTQFMILRGESVVSRLLEMRKEIREKYRNPDEHPVMNLFHCSDSKADAIREAILFFTVDELVQYVGCSDETCFE